MADLRFAGNGAVVNALVHHQPSPNAAAERDVKNGARFGAGPFDRFRQSRRVRVIIHAYRNSRVIPGPSHQIKILPAFDMVGAAGHSRAPIHRPAEPNADRGDAVFVLEIVDRLADLAADPGPACVFFDLETAAVENIGMIIPQDDLQFCPANLDSEIEPFVHEFTGG